MYVDNQWNVVEGPEKEGFLEQVNPIDEKYSVSTETTEVAWRPLPFYDQVALIRVKDGRWTPSNLVIYYLINQGKLTRLDGTSPPIHEMNAEAPIKVNEENVLEYLRFFCFFVRGEDGPFYILESMDDPYLPGDIDDKTRAVIQGTVRPANYEGRDDEGNYLCDGIVFYSDALFEAKFAVQEGGMIEMLDDDSIAGDLPVQIDAPIA